LSVFGKQRIEGFRIYEFNYLMSLPAVEVPLYVKDEFPRSPLKTAWRCHQSLLAAFHFIPLLPPTSCLLLLPLPSTYEQSELNWWV